MLNEISYKNMVGAASIPDINYFVKDLYNKKDSNLTALIFEIKSFNTLNVRFGYEFGAKFLISILRDIIIKTKEYGSLYRLERTVFVVMLNEDKSDALNELNFIIKNILSNYHFDGYTFNIEIISGAIYDLDKSKYDQYQILSMLTSSIDNAKRNDNHELVIFNYERYQEELKNLRLLETIKNSIVDDCKGFYLNYQPFVSAMNGKIIGAEALLRWKDEEFGVVSPMRFISYIEDHSCFYDLGLWIIRKSLSDFKEICLNNKDFFININLSYSQIERKEFRYDVLDIVSEIGFPISNIQFELTERCKNLDVNYLKEQLEFFRSKKIRISLDDFGTGTSTLRLIGDLPIDCVKIDQSFIINILDNPSNSIIVETVLECAKRLGISVCLEGVENKEVKDFVSKYYANYHQGYYYSKPVSLDEFIKKLNNKWITDGIKLIKNDSKASFEVNSVISMMPCGFFIYINDKTERIVLVNEALLDIYECDNVFEFMELTNQSFKGMVHPEDYERVDFEIKDQISKSDKKYDKVKYRIITKNGNIKNVTDYGHLVTKDYNDDIFYVFIAEDLK